MMMNKLMLVKVIENRYNRPPYATVHHLPYQTQSAAISNRIYSYSCKLKLFLIILKFLINYDVGGFSSAILI